MYPYVGARGLTASTDKDSYTIGDDIRIFGKVTADPITQPVLIQVLDPSNRRVRIDQMEPASDGSYSYTFQSGGMMHATGKYTVIVSYKDIEYSKEFDFYVPGGTDAWKIFPIRIGTQSYPVEYKISAGAVRDIVLYEGLAALIVTITSSSNGTLQITFPRNIFDSRTGEDGKSGADEEFTVFADEVSIPVTESESATSATRTLSIDFEQGTETIEIVGTHVIATTPNHVPVIIRAGASSKTADVFSPNPVAIRTGSVITWINKDSTPHTITSGKNGKPDGKFDSSGFNPLLAPQQTFSFTFYRPGRHEYFCALHPNEVGVVKVLTARTRKPKSHRRLSEPIQGHFFFVDIVGLSDPTRGGTESQIKKIEVLHQAIRTCSAYKSKHEKYINLTGDGMVIGFLTGPKLPLELAIQLHKKLAAYNDGKSSHSKVKVRVGIDSAPILEYKDILGQKNIWGDGIVLAKRVMDQAGANDIYLTARAAEALKQFDEYRNVIHPLGKRPIKHGQSVRVYYARGNGFGNRKRK